MEIQKIKKDEEKERRPYEWDEELDEAAEKVKKILEEEEKEKKDYEEL